MRSPSGGAGATAATRPAPSPQVCSQLLVNAKRAKQEKKLQLVAILEQLPDFTMQVCVGGWVAVCGGSVWPVWWVGPLHPQPPAPLPPPQSPPPAKLLSFERSVVVVQLRWELGSRIFGFLLRNYAPDDTYHCTKVGPCCLPRRASRCSPPHSMCAAPSGRWATASGSMER